MAASKPLFPEDEIEMSGSGLLNNAKRLWHKARYEWKQSSLTQQMSDIEPRVQELMAREDMNTLTLDERDVVARWVYLNQTYHTLRRRKFMAESAERISDASLKGQSAWDIEKGKLEKATEKYQSMTFPGGDRASLWSQEAKYMNAARYSADNMRFSLTQRSLDAFKVPKGPERLFHLEPALPPSYQARAALALKNEGKANDRALNDRLHTLIARHQMEVPLEATLSQHSPFGPTVNWMGAPNQTPSPSPSNSSGNSLSNNDNEPPTTVIDKIRKWFAKNGPLGVTLYLTYSALDLTIIYLLLSTGVDVSGLLALVGISNGAGAATFAIAYALHKMLAPPRAALVVFTIPYLKPHWDKLIRIVERQLISRQQAKEDQ